MNLPDMVLFAQKVLFSTALLFALLSHSNLANKLTFFYSITTKLVIYHSSPKAYQIAVEKITVQL